MNIKKIRELDINKQLTKQQPEQQQEQQQEQQKMERKSKLYKFVFWYFHNKRLKNCWWKNDRQGQKKKR